VLSGTANGLCVRRLRLPLRQGGAGRHEG
jgi:hypothetical protein